MKIIQLKEDKVKVTLSHTELLDMDISLDNLTVGSPELSIFLFRVIEAVKRKTSFWADKDEIIVEATKNAGGITLVLSRLTDQKAAALYRRKSTQSVIFELERFYDFCEFLKNISPYYILSMRLYRYDQRFYLALPRHKIPVLIYEYSIKNRKSELLESFLSEYGKLLANGRNLLSISSFLKKTG